MVFSFVIIHGPGNFGLMTRSPVNGHAGRHATSGGKRENVMKLDWLPEAILVVAFLVALMAQATAGMN